jgi:hypothetical protein
VGVLLTVVEPITATEQAGYVGEYVPVDPTVRAWTNDGRPLADRRVDFVITRGGGSVSAASVRTDGQGYASVRWRLGPEPGRNALRARVPGATVVRFFATASTRAVPAAVEVSPGTVTLDAIGAAATLTALVFDSAGGSLPEAVAWTSLDPGIATVDASGVVRSVSNGQARVVASATGGASDTAAVTVEQRVAEVSLTPDTASVAVGDGVQLAAEARDANGHPIEDATMQWASLNPLLVAVTPLGVATGLAAGSAMIAASCDGVADSARVEVVDQESAAVFRSSWLTALGATDAALLDASSATPWTSLLDNGNALRVVDGGAFDIPGNALEVRAVARDGAAGAYAANVRVAGLGVPAVGESQYYRWYIRVTTPNSYTADPLTHPIQDGPQGSRTNWMFEVIPGTDGTWQAGFNVNGGGVNAWPNNRWNLRVALRKNETYRFGLRVERTGTDAWRLHVRVYDAAGQLLYDDDDFRNPNGSATLATAPALRFTDVDWLGYFQGGLNGLAAGSASQFPFVMYYQGAFEIRRDRWPGPN